MDCIICWPEPGLFFLSHLPGKEEARAACRVGLCFLERKPVHAPKLFLWLLSVGIGSWEVWDRTNMGSGWTAVGDSVKQNPLATSREKSFLTGKFSAT